MEKIILFYKYVDITYPKQIQKWQLKLCESLKLKGRILIANEGINATLGGLEENIQAYIEQMKSHELFGDIDFKESIGDTDCFPKLQIKVKNEIVTLGISPEVVSAKDSAKHLNPKQAHELLEKSPDNLVVLDARNKYESEVGHFKGAVLADIRFFREFPEYINSNLELFKDKQVLMYCTGGIRCERASAYLKSKNVAKEIYQIEGGIQRYIENYPEGFFRGKNYVFDGRVTVSANQDIIGKCYICNTSYDDYINCLNASCNRHFVCCPNCIKKLENTCSTSCFNLLNEKKVKQRPPFKKVELQSWE